MGGFKRLALIVVCAGLVLAGFPPGGRAGEANTTVQGEGGMYTQSWFLESFLEVGEDLKEAGAAGKRFAIMWEQRGCPYCRETHVVNFAKPEINNYVRKNFAVLQIDIHGVREVTDFDGTTMTEKEFARKYGVRYTPTVTFYREAPSGGAAPSGKLLELSRMTGYYRPFHFLAAFTYVKEKAYEHQKFGPFVAGFKAARQKKELPVTFR